MENFLDDNLIIFSSKDDVAMSIGSEFLRRLPEDIDVNDIEEVEFSGSVKLKDGREIKID